MDSVLSSTIPGLAVGTLVRARRGNGPVGPMPIEELVVGDVLYDATNVAVRVTWVGPAHVAALKKCSYRQFNSNQIVEFDCSADHKLTLIAHTVQPRLSISDKGTRVDIRVTWATQCAKSLPEEQDHALIEPLDRLPTPPDLDHLQLTDSDLKRFREIREERTACKIEACEGFRFVSRGFPDERQAQLVQQLLLSPYYATIDPKLVRNGHVLELTANDFQSRICFAGKGLKSKMQLYRHRLCTPEDVPRSSEPLPIDAWYVGFYLGDGTVRSTSVASSDLAVGDYLQGIVDRINQEGSVEHVLKKQVVRRAGHISPYSELRNTRDLYTYRISTKPPGPGLNRIRQGLRALGIFDSKAGGVPRQILTGSDEDKLKCLAGLIDSDGNRHGLGYSITQVGAGHANIIHTARSLAESLDISISRVYEKKPRDTISNRRPTSYTINLTTNSAKLRPYLQVPRKRAAPLTRVATDMSRPLTVTEGGVGWVKPIEVEGRRFQLADGVLAHC